MVVPIVASISRELFTSVPSDLKQGSMALGSTRWEMIKNVAIPQVGGGIIAGTMLGLRPRGRRGHRRHPGDRRLAVVSFEHLRVG